MLARAFMDDPVANWACAVAGLRPRVLERFHGARLRHLLGHEEVWTTDTLASAALWAPPDEWKTTVRQDLELARCVLYPRLLPRVPFVVAGLLRLESVHPRDRPPHWYLAVLGTDPSSQGQGLASAVLAGVLSQCDADGVAAYLESSNERNIAFYARHGFRVIDELHLPRGPTMWLMWRDPVP
jgi:ribosomal protein S18 acetylase RimI-like enzyme